MTYHDQTGSVSGSRHFANQRGIKQGNVISPLLFNVALELAVRSWKRRPSHHGLALDNAERLTNMRYADDLMIYAKYWEELCVMLETLGEELAAIGLHVLLFVTETRL